MGVGEPDSGCVEAFHNGPINCKHIEHTGDCSVVHEWNLSSCRKRLPEEYREVIRGY